MRDIKKRVNIFPGEVKICLIDLREYAKKRTFYEFFLNLFEKEKAGKFKFDKDRQKYILRKGILKEFLCFFLERPLCQDELLNTKNGKPYLKNNDFYFNTSSSGDFFCMAFCKGTEIGIDIEKEEPDFDYLPVIDSYFSEREKNNLGNMESGCQRKYFYRRWTAREAWLKAEGRGLGGLSELQKKFDSDCLKDIESHLFEMDIVPGYTVTLATRQQFRKPRVTWA